MITTSSLESEREFSNIMCQSERAVGSDGDCRKRSIRSEGGWDPFKPMLEYFSIPYRLFVQVIIEARRGQLLPQFTLLLVLQLVFHFVVSFEVGDSTTPSSPLLQHVSLFLLLLSGLINIGGYALLVALYRHSVQTIFNRNLPSSMIECIPSFAAHLSLLKPLEVIFRYATARFRVLPDILVLGEVRCGTTTLCQHLSSIEGCEPPFCLWKHPELDHKETFYFVGHYLGRVDPFHYRMCFPLAIVKWFRERVCGRPFFTYDGCAQYLTNPAVPHLVAKAYRDAGQPPPVLVACVRNPVDQAVSWWRYENNAMLCKFHWTHCTTSRRQNSANYFRTFTLFQGVAKWDYRNGIRSCEIRTIHLSPCLKRRHFPRQLP